jgi:hypothetical protein
LEPNGYSVSPAHAGRIVTVVASVGDPLLRIISAASEVIAEHRRAPVGAGLRARGRVTPPT